jgi:hypothetical protein
LGFGQGAREFVVHSFLWILLKGILSICLLGLVLGASPSALASAHTLSDYGAWLLISGALIAASGALWIDWRQPHPRLQIVGGVLLVLVSFGLAYSNFTDRAFPHDCSGRRKKLFCMMENELYELGGRVAVAIPPLMMVFLLGWALYVRLKRGLKAG